MKTPRLLLACSLCILSAALSAETTTWTNVAGAVVWNDAANWSDGVPTGTMTAVLQRGNYRVCWRMTPDANFVGRIVTTNYTDTLDVAQPTYVELGGATEGTWSVCGNGTVIATDGIAARLADDFVGTVDIPAGMSFAVPSSLSSAVTFTGSGELVLDSDARLAQASGFTGKIVCEDGTTRTIADAAWARTATLRLGDGTTLDYPERTLAWGAVREFDGWTVPGAWSFNADCTQIDRIEGEGSKWAFDRSLPSVAQDGSMTLLNDALQIHTAFLTNRLLRATDDWGVSFTAKTALPAHSQYDDVNKGMTGWFGFFLQDVSPTDVGTSFSAPVPGGYGFIEYCYRGGGLAGVNWQFATGGYSLSTSLNESILDGIRFDQPVHYTVTCVGGVMTVNLAQDGKSIAMRRDLTSYLSAHPQGVYLGFGAGGDWWQDDNIALLEVTLRDFRGWVRAKTTGGWQPIAENGKLWPLTSENWLLLNRTGDDVVTGDDTLNADGTFDFLPHTDGKNTRSATAGSQVALSARKRYVISVDYDWGTRESSPVEGYTIALCKWRPNENDWQFKGQDITLDAWSFYAGLTHYIYHIDDARRNYASMTVDTYETDGTHRQDSSGQLWGAFPRVDSAHVHLDYLYDPAGTLAFEITRTNKSDEKSGLTTILSRTFDGTVMNAFLSRGKQGGSDSDDNMYLTLHGKCVSWGSLPTTLTGVTIREIGDNADARLGAVEVADSASATVRVPALVASSETAAAQFSEITLGTNATLTVATPAAGAQVACPVVTLAPGASLNAGTGVTLACDTFAVPSTDANLKLAGAITLGEEVTFVIPRALLRELRGRRMVDFTEATLVGGQPLRGRVLDETGADCTAEYSILITNKGLDIRSTGLSVIVR